MTFDEALKALFESNPGDWLFDDPKGTYTYKHDLLLRIDRANRDDCFNEEWATGFPDPCAKRVSFEVFYGPSFICRQILVAVDGYRAYLPMPKVNTKLIDQNAYRFARIVANHNDDLDKYIAQAKLRVDSH